MTVDILAIAAHRDDVELTCAGTLIKARKLGRTTAVIDLTAGEMGTMGDAKSRAAEAEASAKVMGLSARENLGLPDAAIVNDPTGRGSVAREFTHRCDHARYSSCGSRLKSHPLP